jgi:DNA processing protein
VIRIAGKDEIEREFTLAEACGARFVALGEEEYPALLRKIDSEPPVVALRGALSVFTRPAVAVKSELMKSEKSLPTKC